MRGAVGDSLMTDLVHRAPGRGRRVLDRVFGGDHHRESARARSVAAVSLDHAPTEPMTYWRKLLERAYFVLGRSTRPNNRPLVGT